MARCVQSSAHRAGVKIQPRGEGGGAWVCVDVVLFLQDVREEEGARLMPWGGTAPSDGGVDSCEEEQAKAAHRGGQRQARLWGGEGEPQRRLGSPALGDEGYRIDGAEDSEFPPLSWPWRPTQWTGMCGRTKARAASSIVRPVENKVKTAKMNQDEGRDGKTRCEAEWMYHNADDVPSGL